MRTYKTMLMTSSIPNRQLDDVAATVAAGAAADTVAAGAAADTVVAGAAADTVAAGAAADTVAAGAADDKIDLKAKPDETLLDPKAKDAPAEIVVPEAYTLKGPEGVELDTALVEKATPIFKELGLDDARAQKVVDLYANEVLPGVAQQVQGETLRLLGMSDIAKWTEQVKADPEIGGANLEENLAMAAQARDAFATPKLRELLTASRLGNHPEVVRLFAKIGRKVGEGTVIKPDPGKVNTGGAESFYDPAFSPKG